MGLNATPQLEEIIQLLPNEILVDERYNVRPWTSDEGASEIEAESIELMADSIELHGQFDAGIVEPSKTKTTDGKEQYKLVAGHRRKKAIAIVNERRAAKGQSLILMRLRVDRSGGDMKRIAAQSNLHRDNPNPMDTAKLMDNLRSEFGWGHDMTGHKQVAKYLNIKLQTVLQHQRILRADPEIQKRVANGQLSMIDAHNLAVGVKPEMLPEVFQNAERIQAESDKQQAERNEGFVKGHGSKEQREELKAKKDKAATEPDAEPKKPKRIKHTSVVKALGEVAGALIQVQAKSRKEIVALFEEIADGPAYGAVDCPAREFARYLVDKWASGNGTDKTLLAKFDAMAGLDAADKKKNEKVAAAEREEQEKLEAEKKAAEKAKKKKKVKSPKSLKSPKPVSPVSPVSDAPPKPPKKVKVKAHKAKQAA